MKKQQDNTQEDVMTVRHADGVTRRQFVVFMGMTGVSLLGFSAIAGCNSSNDTQNSQQETTTDTTDTTTDTTTTTEETPKTKKVLSFDGIEVEIPYYPERIAALAGTTTDPIIFLGQAARIVTSMNLTINEWTEKMYPTVNYDTIHKFENAQDPNVEELLDLDVDLVLYWPGERWAEQVQKMQDAGLVVFGAHTSNQTYSNYDEFMTLIKREMRMYGEILGGDCPDKAERWVEYTENVLNGIKERTDALTEDQIKKVHYLRKSEEGLQVYGANSYPAILVEAAGGKLDSFDSISGFGDMTMEQIVLEDPEYVFGGWTSDLSFITSDASWSSVKAVKDNHVYLSPCSLGSFWAYGAEVPLEAMFLAKTLHPELFEDMDLIQEVRDFYKEFRGYDATAADVENMLVRKGPAE